ncbi:uncharacterized protein G2W53_039196 [Senna tora]|uniref:Uncharacterized protein n=1 Tax=Senna tora TaxID=362788 RepID=A0A834W2L8_9FABA|nr:uncharacterized protein G2W53_039196 [Senna tora]
MEECLGLRIAQRAQRINIKTPLGKFDSNRKMRERHRDVAAIGFPFSKGLIAISNRVFYLSANLPKSYLVPTREAFSSMLELAHRIPQEIGPTGIPPNILNDIPTLIMLSPHLLKPEGALAFTS